jgi:hypothetical protein
MRLTLAVLLAASSAACASTGGAGAGDPPRQLEGSPRRLNPRDLGTVLFLGLDLPDAGTVIGGHYAGAAFEVRQTTYRMSEAARAGWARAARLRGETVLHGAGFLVRSVGAATSDLVTVDEDVRFGIQGRVSTIEVRTFARAGARVEARVEVAWDLLDVPRGSVIFGRTHAGTSRTASRMDEAVADAFDVALSRLVEDTLFQAALLAPIVATDVAGAPGEFIVPVADEPIPIAAADLNPSLDSGAVERVLAGVVTLRSPDQVYGTAFLLSRSGLGLTTNRVVRQTRRLRARLPSGVVRPVRVLRHHTGLDVALIQVACPAACPTVDWDGRGLPAVNAAIVTVGAPAGDAAPPVVARGRIGGRWGLAHGVTLDTQGDELVSGGEPVALASSGKVVGLVSGRPGRRTALLLREVLRVLRVTPPRPA